VDLGRYVLPAGNIDAARGLLIGELAIARDWQFRQPRRGLAGQRNDLRESPLTLSLPQVRLGELAASSARIRKRMRWERGRPDYPQRDSPWGAATTFPWHVSGAARSHGGLGRFQKSAKLRTMSLDRRPAASESFSIHHLAGLFEYIPTHAPALAPGAEAVNFGRCFTKSLQLFAK
jgi:hypothetical protein